MSYRDFPVSTVVNVVDGDTFDASIDLGFSIYHKVRFRLAGLNAPEVGKLGAKQATNWLREQLLDKAVSIRSYKVDKYGRFVAEVFVDGVNINTEMKVRGLAVPYMLDQF